MTVGYTKAVKQEKLEEILLHSHRIVNIFDCYFEGCKDKNLREAYEKIKEAEEHINDYQERRSL